MNKKHQDLIKKQGVSVIVPVFNSEATLLELIHRIEKALVSFTDSFEIIFVNDGSSDNCWSIICDLAEKNNFITGLNLMCNYGQHDALLTGIRTARKDIIVTIDDDLQHPPEEIHHLINKLNEGYDVVYGTPEKEKHGMWRNITSVTTKSILKHPVGIDIAQEASAFRAFNSKIREAFENYSGPFVDIDALLSWGTTKFTSVKVRRDARQEGKSAYTLGKLIAYLINTMTSFTTVPLRLASLTGFVFTLFGIGILVYVIGCFFIYGTVVPGFPFLASIITIFAGAQLLTLGIIGEYLAKMHFRSMGKPTSVIRETTDKELK